MLGLCENGVTSIISYHLKDCKNLLKNSCVCNGNFPYWWKIKWRQLGLKKNFKNKKKRIVIVQFL